MKIPIIAGIIAVIVIIVVTILASYQESDIAEVEDTLDKEIQPVEIPEIQEKLDEIERIKNENDYTPLPREWQSSGPFEIDRKEYAIGEKIFLRIGGLDHDAKGQVTVMRPLNATHYSVYLTIPFDGTQRDAFNYYLEPSISATRNICSVDDLIGKWTLVFRGTNHQNLDFEITDKVVPGTSTEPVC
ncbi:MAG: hypothetical protein IS860_00925 [Nitrosopumilus sp.]|nr:hypothetical protein [Nitrosopumilus sp.]MCE2505737.1 hypothetical protein [Nitrosopumilaceae archaeon]